MTAFDKKVNQIAARHGWNISPVSGWYIPAYSIVPMDRKERDQITAALNRCKSFHVDVLQAFSACAWTCTILIRDRAEWEALQKHQHTADLIRNAFIEAYHFNGHDDRGVVKLSPASPRRGRCVCRPHRAGRRPHRGGAACPDRRRSPRRRAASNRPRKTPRKNRPTENRQQKRGKRGAGRVYLFFRVILPGCRPGRAAGIHRGPFFPAWRSRYTPPRFPRRGRRRCSNPLQFLSGF